MNSEVVICLPARYQSSRLPGKPLINIAGKPLIIWALESAAQINARQMVVATDDRRIFDLVEAKGYQAIITSNKHQSGTDRIAEVAHKLSWSDDTIVVNYQADEPQIPKTNINQLVMALKNNPQASISTLYQPIESFEDLVNPNNVKLVCDDQDYALYFSRAAIPYSRDTFVSNKLDESMVYKHHIGIYAYRANFLKKFSLLKPTQIERTESLEQLRAMSYGYKIVAQQAHEMMPHGIDTPADIKRFESNVSRS